ncbi:MAG: nuclear transport factor 2 family protein [Solirubrobacterales bacterium]
MDPVAEQLLRDTYRAFNDRDIDAVLESMHPDVDWPNAWEGGRVSGRAAVAAYWKRQFEQISSRLEAVALDEEDDGAIAVTVRQLVSDAKSGELLSEATVTHRYRLRDGLVARMDVLD